MTKENVLNELKEKLDSQVDYKGDPDYHLQMKLLFMWVKQDHVKMRTFVELTKYVYDVHEKN